MKYMLFDGMVVEVVRRNTNYSIVIKHATRVRSASQHMRIIVYESDCIPYKRQVENGICDNQRT